MATSSLEKSALPHRSTGGMSADDDAVPDTDPSDVGSLPHVAAGDAALTHE